MNILVLNGSPKGDNSVTMTYVKYLELVFPEHEFQVRHVAQSIHRLEKEEETFDELMQEVKQSQVILWAFPLYFMLVHGNYKRFIELIFERQQEQAFAGKYTASLSTSIHFFDHTAHHYIHGICEDLGMCFVTSFSAEMRDLMEEQERENLRTFLEGVIHARDEKMTAAKVFPMLVHPDLKYEPGLVTSKTDLGDLKLLVLTDTTSTTENLRNMVRRFCSSFVMEPEVVDLAQIRIAGGCLGCLKCGMDNECAYDGKDDVRMIYEEKLKQADIVVFALAMKDRYFSARWKSFLDRRFYQTHQPGLPGKQIGYLISGPLSLEQNLRQMIQAMAEFDQANLVDLLTDEVQASESLDRSITEFAEKLVWYARRNFMQPRTFLGVGGTKLFRDELWGRLRFVFQEDYRYYKRHGMMDFPQSNFITRLTHFAIPLTRIGPIRKQIQKKTKDMMHRSQDRVLKQEEEKKTVQKLIKRSARSV